MSRRSLVSASSLNLVALALQLALRVVGLGLLAFVLGPAGQGEVALAYLVATVGAGAAAVGLETALMRSAALHATRLGARAAVWTQSAVVLVASACLLAALAAVLSPPLAVMAGLAALPSLLFLRLAASCALGEGRDWSFVALTTLPWAAVGAALSALAAAGSLTTDAALAAFASATVLTAAASAAVLAARQRPAFDRAPWRNEAYRTGARVYPGTFAQLANYRFDQLVIAALLSRADLGMYVLAVAASEAGSLPAQATANAVLPRAATERRSFVRPAVLGAAVGLLVVPVFVAAVLLLLPAYEGALLPFFVLLPGMVAISLAKVLAAAVVGRGEPGRVSQLTLLALAATVVATVTLVPLFGLAGAAAASSLAYAVLAAALVRATGRPKRRRPAPARVFGLDAPEAV